METVADNMAAEDVQAVVFRAGQVTFGADIRDVREIIRLDGVVAMPGANRDVEGITRVRGEVLPLLSLRSLTGLPPGARDEATRVLVLDRRPPLGLIVDLVDEVRAIPGTAIEPVPPITGCARGDSLYRGIAKLPDRMIILMDLKKISTAPDDRAADYGPAAAEPAAQAPTDGGPAERAPAEDQGAGGAGLALTDFQLDALRELGNIGTSHAATSFSQLVSSLINITVPAIRVEKIDRVSGIVTDEKVVGLLLEIRAEDHITGFLYTMFPMKSAYHIIDTLLALPQGTTTGIGEVEQSAIMEVGNILASSFCDAVADFLDIELVPSPPSFVCDMAGAIVESSLIAIGQMADEVIVFRTELIDEQRNCDGYVILFPNPEMLGRMLDILEAKAKP